MIVVHIVSYVFNISFTICSFLFYIFLLFVYFHKSTLNSIKNVIFKRMIFTGIFAFLFEILYLILIQCSHSLLLIGIIKKLVIISSILILLLWIYYVLIIAFEKNDKVSNFISQHHTTIDIYIMIVLIVFSIIEFILPFSYSLGNHTLVRFVKGAGIIFPWIIASIFSLIPIPFIIHQKCFYKKNLIFS